ncbi:MAG: hypothetical protein GWM98_15325, partial [Nitrospinaceae bacterium]|nr:P27 family phage terminase small subunit [Nitrospinaceae bacterium]NIR55595.1 P27 family phage terminase small subunit [Nitrospinaceae bacterium]NIS86029.1 P27 family phage terminase small subunit [Nitrospinaceae bacterium]NIT82872.1 P27 family phage terminase small subunit [Nitrospinaceae bacterium]NIU45077.1 P27 family phage terminase small subunit [Nitrospinaceae bacterium]
VIPELIETGVLARIDGPAVALYCILHGQLEKYVNEPSMFPASKISQYRAAMSDLGLNPAARTKIPGSKEKDKKKNPYAAAPNKKRGRTG